MSSTGAVAGRSQPGSAKGNYRPKRESAHKKYDKLFFHEKTRQDYEDFMTLNWSEFFDAELDWQRNGYGY